MSGLRLALQYEKSFQYEVIIAIPLISGAFYLNVSYLERLMLVGTVMLVLIVELLNTAVEKLIDGLGNPYNQNFKFTKDAGSAAVFLSVLLCCFVWGSILIS